MASLKSAIEGKCKECTYDPYIAGSWRSQVQDCTIKKCPLWEVRPVTMETTMLRRKDKSTKPDTEEE